MGGIYCSYTIFDPKDEVHPNDVLNGIFYIHSDEKKDKVLKNVEIQLYERFEEYGYNDFEEKHMWEEREVHLKDYPIAQNIAIRPGEEIEVPFAIRLVGTWQPKTDKAHRNWSLELQFCQKTGMFTTRGADEDGATCVLPVRGSSKAPSIHQMR